MPNMLGRHFESHKDLLVDVDAYTRFPRAEFLAHARLIKMVISYCDHAPSPSQHFVTSGPLGNGRKPTRTCPLPETQLDIGHGSGLGLAIARAIIQAHAGTLTVESQVGAGTTFTLTLPIG